MSRRHILVSDGKSGKEVHDDLKRNGFDRVEVHSREELHERADPHPGTTADAPLGARSGPGGATTGLAGASASTPEVIQSEADAVAAGQMLLVVDYPDDRRDDLDRLLQKHPAALGRDVGSE